MLRLVNAWLRGMMAISKGKGGCFKKTGTVCFYNIQLHSIVYTTEVEILVLQTAKDLSDVLLMEEIVSKTWKVSSGTFLLAALRR